MGFFPIFGSEGIRNAMKNAYEKGFKLAGHNMTELELAEGITPHEKGLHHAFRSRKIVRRMWRGEKFSENVIYAELLPFMLMDELDAVDALAEFAVFQEMPNEANMPFLRRLINQALSKPIPDSMSFQKILAETESTGGIDTISLAAFCFINECTWIYLLDSPLYEEIEKKAIILLEDIEDEEL